MQEFGLKLFEITSSGLTHSLSDDIPYGQYLQTFFYPETYNVEFYLNFKCKNISLFFHK